MENPELERPSRNPTETRFLELCNRVSDLERFKQTATEQLRETQQYVRQTEQELLKVKRHPIAIEEWQRRWKDEV